MKPLAETVSFHSDSVGSDGIWLEEKREVKGSGSRTDEEMTVLECGWFLERALKFGILIACVSHITV